MQMLHPFFLVAVVLLFPPTSANAAKQYRCNGRVQYRPCAPEPELVRQPVYRPQVETKAQMRPTESLKYAKVITSSLERVSKRDGVWGGRVEGNGTVHLELRIFRAGTLESRRYMGNVPLRNKSTAFRFRSVMPSGLAWSWEIVARAT